ncbi:MAG TPA: hypothetical protein VHE12_05885 [bacterium]|nr:hypothetical protein [bacterium]
MKFIVSWTSVGQSVVEAEGPKEAEEIFKANRDQIIKDGNDERHLELFIHKA